MESQSTQLTLSLRLNHVVSMLKGFALLIFEVDCLSFSRLGQESNCGTEFGERAEIGIDSTCLKLH